MGDDRSLRYSRHELLRTVGKRGQDSIRRGMAVVVGLGGLGGTAAVLLARAGVGSLRLVDPDRVDWSNMQRQALYDEEDAEQGRCKAEAAARRLKAINSEVTYELVPEALSPANAEAIVQGANVVVDCLDNFRSRAVLNQACVKSGVPLVHGACVATHGTVTTILPGKTACYECIVPDAATRTAVHTSSTVGVFAPAVFAISSIQAAEALKILSGDEESTLKGKMMWLDVWAGEVTTFSVPRNPDCPVCGRRRFPLLTGT